MDHFVQGPPWLRTQASKFYQTIALREKAQINTIALARAGRCVAVGKINQADAGFKQTRSAKNL